MSIKVLGSTGLLFFNLKQYFDRELINNGFYTNIPSGFFDYKGNRADVLKRVNPRLYESAFDNWVFETDGLGSPSFPTINASGVRINGVFHAKGSSPFFPEIDYKNGRVLFSSDISAGSEVQTEFSYKHVDVRRADSNVRNLVFSAIKDNTDFTTQATFPSGNMRQFPAIIIDPQRSIPRPRRIGGGQIENRLISFIVLANNSTQADRLADFLSEEQFRRVILGVDYNKAPQLFTVNNDREPTYVNYSDLQADLSLAWQKIYINEARILEIGQFFDWYMSRIEWQVDVYKPSASML